MSVTIVVPTYNEGPNVAELVRRVAAATTCDTRIVFVDDSTDDTPAIIADVAAHAPVPVRLIHRDRPQGGLSGAVVEGLRVADTDWSIVMDGDLQHPPEMLPVLLEAGQATGADIVVASRYCGHGGDAGGLDGTRRRLVSKASSVLARSMFPVRLRNVTDPMTGFFAVRTAAVDLAALRPRGFKVLLEILARNKLTVVEEPFVFGPRFAGTSKATMAQGLRYLQQLAALRFGRMSRFAIIGGVGTVLNLAIMAILQATGVHYVPAAITANIVTIICNFLLQERLVFHDLRNEGRGVWHRFAQSFTFNGIEAAVRTLLLSWVVEATPVTPLIAQALIILVAFVVRFVFHAQVVYRPRRTSPASPLLPPELADGEPAEPSRTESHQDPTA